MLRQAREIFKDDYVKVGKRKYRFGTIPYWTIRIGQGLLGFGCCYSFYIALWLIGTCA